MKNKSDPSNNRGYRISFSNYSLSDVDFFKKLIPLPNSKSDKSRDEGGIENDKGNYSLFNGGFLNNNDVLLLRNPEKRGPIADEKAMEIYAECFGGKINDGILEAPKEQNYKQVRNRIGFIYGLVADQISRGWKNSALWSLTMGSEYENLPMEDRELIINTIDAHIKSGDLHFER
jgi:hypothetical protein